MLFRFLMLSIVAFSIVLPSFSGAEPAPTIAAAADLKFAMQDISEIFTQQTGQKVEIIFGSAGNLRRQIVQGAPFQMFLSADEQFIFDLYKEGFMLDEGTLYAVGRIVIFAPHGSPLKPDKDLKDLKTALEDGRLKRFAIANPAHAPYGKRAQEALVKAGLWEKLQSKLVYGEDMVQATQFAANGSSQGGILSYSFVCAPSVARLGTYALIPAEWHKPLQQRMALLKSAGDTAKQFYTFVQAPAAREVFKRYGFVLPGE